MKRELVTRLERLERDVAGPTLTVEILRFSENPKGEVWRRLEIRPSGKVEVFDANGVLQSNRGNEPW